MKVSEIKRPKSKAISWNICRQCNYNCAYCAQGKNHSGLPSAASLIKLTTFFRGLSKGWEIKISSSEPFLCPGFSDIIGCLTETGIKISVVTNFSFQRDVYKKFLETCGEHLRSFSASLHREQVDWQKFLSKCLWIKQEIGKTKKGSLVVNTVVEPGKTHELIEIKNRFKEEGIRFYPQLLRVKGKTVVYSPEEQTIIMELAGDRNPFQINAGYSLKGKTCFAGMNYFVVTAEGRCYTCYPGKRDESGYLGCILTGDFKFREEPLRCPYEVCPCTVPINRGMAVF